MKKTRILALLLAVSVLCSMLMVMPVSAAFTATGTTEVGVRTYQNRSTVDQAKAMLISFENKPNIGALDGQYAYGRLNISNVGSAVSDGVSYVEGAYGKAPNDVSLKMAGVHYLYTYGALGLQIVEDAVTHIAFQFAIPKEDTSASFVPIDFQTGWGEKFGFIDDNAAAHTPVVFTKGESGADNTVTVFGHVIPGMTWNADTWYDLDVLLTHGTEPTLSVYINGDPVNLSTGTFDGVKTTSVNVAIDGDRNTAGRQSVMGAGVGNDIRIAPTQGGRMVLDNISFRTWDPSSEYDLRNDIVKVYTMAPETISANAVGTTDEEGNTIYELNGNTEIYRNYMYSWGSSDLLSVSLDLKEADRGVEGRFNEKALGAYWTFAVDNTVKSYWTGGGNLNQSAYGFESPYVATPAIFKSEFINQEAIFDMRHAAVKQFYIGGVPQLTRPSDNKPTMKPASGSGVTMLLRPFSNSTKAAFKNATFNQYIYKPQIKSLTYDADGTNDLAVPYNTTSIKLNLAGGLWPSGDVTLESILDDITLTDAAGNPVTISERAYDSTYRTVTLTLPEGALMGNTNYQVKMPKEMQIYNVSGLGRTTKTLSDISGGIDYVYDFKTGAAPVFEVVASRFMEWIPSMDTNGNEEPDLDEYTHRYATSALMLVDSGRVNAKVTLRNTTGEEKKVRFLYAIYDKDDYLHRFKVGEEVAVPSDGADHEFWALDKEGLNHIAGWGMKLKVFVWSDLDGMNPVHHEPLYLWRTIQDNEIPGLTSNHCHTEATYHSWNKYE